MALLYPVAHELYPLCKVSKPGGERQVRSVGGVQPVTRHLVPKEARVNFVLCRAHDPGTLDACKQALLAMLDLFKKSIVALSLLEKDGGVAVQQAILGGLE